MKISVLPFAEAVNRQKIVRFVEWIVGLSALWLIFLTARELTFAELRVFWQQVSFLHLAGLLLFNVLLVLLLADRWWLVLRLLGERIPYLAVTEYRLIGATISVLTPGPQFGGEPAQIDLLVRRQQVPVSRAIASVALEKTLELIANFTFLSLAATFLLLQNRGIAYGRGWTAPVLAAGLVTLPAVLLATFWWNRHPFSTFLGKVAGLLPDAAATWLRTKLLGEVRTAEHQIATLLRHHPWALLVTLFVSLGNWLPLVAEYWLATRILGLNLTTSDVLTLLVALRLAVLLPMPAGVGPLEASQVLTFSLLGLGPAAGVGMSIVIRIRDLMLIGLGLGLAHRNGGFRRRRPALAGVEPAVRPEGTQQLP